MHTKQGVTHGNICFRNGFPQPAPVVPRLRQTWGAPLSLYRTLEKQLILVPPLVFDCSFTAADSE